MPWFFNAPDHEYPSHLELELTATDSNGSIASTSVELDPKTVDLTLEPLPAGLDLTLNANTAGAPFTTTVIEGSNNSITAPSPQILGGQPYSWHSWSDGGAQTHNITADDTTTYSAAFTEPGTQLTLPGPALNPELELDVEAKKKQRAPALALVASCPEEPCAVTAGGRARGVRFELKQAEASLQAGQPELLRLRATSHRKLARLQRRLESGDIQRPVIARIDVAATDLVEGGTAHELVKLQLEA